MNHTGIEYLVNQGGSPGYVWNFQTGCLNKQNGVCNLPCWAEAMAKRFHRDFKPEYHSVKLSEPLKGNKEGGRRIGVCFTGDLFGDWINDPTLESACKTIMRSCPLDQFFFLTKCPWNLHLWGRYPDNAWVGVTCIEQSYIENALPALGEVDAKHKWLSLEPLLGEPRTYTWVDVLKQHGIGWIVVGGQTHPTKMPERAWVDKIVAACRCAGIPVFLKNNLKPLMGDNLIQELPPFVPLHGTEMVKGRK